MKYLSTLLLSLLLLGCARNTNESDDNLQICSVSTDTTLFDENDYWNATPSVRPAIMSQDPLAIYQWHLYNIYNPNEDLNLLPVWQSGRYGEGITIGIIDSGVDASHTDLKQNYRANYSFNYRTKRDDPSPIGYTATCAHGTATAGIAAARGLNGGIGVMGVAPQASFSGLNIGLGCGFSASEIAAADALSVKSDRYGSIKNIAIDIFSNSWGCAIDDLDCISQAELDSMVEGVVYGRGGKGAIYVFAAGNDRASNGDSNYFSKSNIFEVITVAALDHTGKQAFYSNTGSNLLISAYGGVNKGVVTTDISGCDRGFDSKAGDLMPHRLNSKGEYTHLMNGTSAATPMISGVVALMLQAKPALTWRDVRYILATTARQNDYADSSWRTNGTGKKFSHKYGFGVADATAAVNTASSFTSLSALQEFEANQNVNVNFTHWTMQKTITVPSYSVQKIEFVELYIDIVEPNAKKVKIKLTSPSGMEAIISDGKFTFPKNYFASRKFGSNAFLDENSTGEWKLDFEGDATSATFNSFKLTFKGRS